MALESHYYNVTTTEKESMWIDSFTIVGIHSWHGETLLEREYLHYLWLQ